MHVLHMQSSKCKRVHQGKQLPPNTVAHAAMRAALPPPPGNNSLAAVPRRRATSPPTNGGGSSLALKPLRPWKEPASASITAGTTASSMNMASLASSSTRPGSARQWLSAMAKKD